MATSLLGAANFPPGPSRGSLRLLIPTIASRPLACFSSRPPICRALRTQPIYCSVSFVRRHYIYFPIDRTDAASIMLSTTTKANPLQDGDAKPRASRRQPGYRREKIQQTFPDYSKPR